MAGDTNLTFDALPNVTPYYLRAVTTFSGGLSKNETIPDLTARIDNLSVRAEDLARYRKVCGFARRAHLPITYPHVLAFPLHMAVLTHRAFPLKLLGLVHVRNEITRKRPFDVNESLDLRVSISGHRETSKGVEFDLITEAFGDDDVLGWQAKATMLSRQKTSVSDEGDRRRKSAPVLDFAATEHADWFVPADIGRRYAAVAGDYNLIHLSPWSARLFGFKRAIAHGMWTKARVAAALSDHLGDRACTMSVSFKKPVFLPNNIVFQYAPAEGHLPFALTDTAGEIHHLTGTLDFQIA